MTTMNTATHQPPAKAAGFAPEKPAWLAAWKTQEETLAIFRLLRPRLHKTTLGRMRRQGKIEATKFAGEWYYKPETALPPVGN
jgi:hypothetical protein